MCKRILLTIGREFERVNYKLSKPQYSMLEYPLLYKNIFFPKIMTYTWFNLYYIILQSHYCREKCVRFLMLHFQVFYHQ